MRTGGCHCGAVRFAFDTEPRDIGYCHCSHCRRLTGSAFAAYCEVPDRNLNVTAGLERIVRYAATAKLDKHFCGACGVTLFTRHRSFAGSTYVALGVLDDDAGIAPAYHQFVASKAKWYEIGDALPQFAEWDDDPRCEPTAKSD